MKKSGILSAISLMLFFLVSCSSGSDTKISENNEIKDNTVTTIEADETSGSNETGMEETKNMTENNFYITANGTTLTAVFEDNSSAEALKALLAEEDLTVEMSDYGNFEKVGSLGQKLTTNDHRITTEPGDVILYQGNSITIYYGTNTWNFTRLGKINDATRDSLLDVLGEGDVTVTFSLNNPQA